MRICRQGVGHSLRTAWQASRTSGSGLRPIWQRQFRSLKTEWIPTVGYMTAQKAHRDISHYLMHRYNRYNWIRPHQFNGGLPPAQAEKNLTSCPGLVDHYTGGDTWWVWIGQAGTDSQKQESPHGAGFLGVSQTVWDRSGQLFGPG